MKKRHMALIAILMTTVVFVSCSRTQKMLKPDTEMPESISIGVIVAETGEYADPYGFLMLQGFELARDEINTTEMPTPLNLVVVDDRSTLEGTVSAPPQKWVYMVSLSRS